MSLHSNESIIYNASLTPGCSSHDRAGTLASCQHISKWARPSLPVCLVGSVLHSAAHLGSLHKLYICRVPGQKLAIRWQQATFLQFLSDVILMMCLQDTTGTENIGLRDCCAAISVLKNKNKHCLLTEEHVLLLNGFDTYRAGAGQGSIHEQTFRVALDTRFIDLIFTWLTVWTKNPFWSI